MRRIDIVYILKEDIDPNELIYSLRSVDENFPHRKVWFVGGQPSGLVPDGRIIHHQEGYTKWERVRSSLKTIIDCKEITDDFYLFNDDFFVLKKMRGEFLNLSNGTLEKRIRDIEKKQGKPTRYSRSLTVLKAELVHRGLDTVSFAVHMPMLVNKDKIAEVFKNFNMDSMFRSAYGNYHHIPYKSHDDVKIYDRETIPDVEWEYLSTTEETFREGNVGKFIRMMFPNPSRFEQPIKTQIKELYTQDGEERYE